MHNNNIGFYRVGQETFFSKVAALIRGTELNIHPEWCLAREEFAKVPWDHEPTETLEQLYAERARQLRDKYDYLILSYSGGSDSKNILDAFLKNNIRIDELVSKYSYKSFGNSYEPTLQDRRHDFNLGAEWEFTAKVDFQYLAQHHPEIKLTYDDWYDNPVLGLNDGWFMNRFTILSPFADQRRTIRHLKSTSKYTNVGYIYGIDKPMVAYKDGEFYLYFLDGLANSFTPEGSNVNNATVEWFYWAPESEKLLRKQAHVIKRYFQQHPEKLHMISWPNGPKTSKTEYDNLVRSLVYPGWDPLRFQVAKCDDMVAGLDKLLLWGHKHLQDQHTSDLKLLNSLIDKKYHNPKGGYVGMISPFYKI